MSCPGTHSPAAFRASPQRFISSRWGCGSCPSSGHLGGGSTYPLPTPLSQEMVGGGWRECRLGERRPLLLTLAVLPAGEEAVACGAEALVAALCVFAGVLSQVSHTALVQVWPQGGGGGGAGRETLSHKCPAGLTPAYHQARDNPGRPLLSHQRFLPAMPLPWWLRW